MSELRVNINGAKSALRSAINMAIDNVVKDETKKAHDEYERRLRRFNDGVAPFVKQKDEIIEELLSIGKEQLTERIQAACMLVSVSFVEHYNQLEGHGVIDLIIKDESNE